MALCIPKQLVNFVYVAALRTVEAGSRGGQQCSVMDCQKMLTITTQCCRNNNNAMLQAELDSRHGFPHTDQGIRVWK